MCYYCMVDNKAFLRSYTQVDWIGYYSEFEACPYDTRAHVYHAGRVGSYVFSYVYSFCDGASASITAFLGGYCATSLTEG